MKTIELKISKISKVYPLGHGVNIKALNDISFELQPGLYGLLGPNGAGKSSLINIITGNLNADRGQVYWGGKLTKRCGKNFRRALGYMPQQQELYRAFTGKLFLEYLCGLKEIPRAKIFEEIERVAALVNLSDQLQKRLGQYSGGMRQRILAAAAMIGDPKLIIMDEPTAGLDPKERVRFRNMMNSQAKKSIVIIATHVVSDVEAVADKIILLNQGNIEYMDTPDALIAALAPGRGLEDVYLNVFGE